MLKFGKLAVKALPASKNGTIPIVSVTLTRTSADASNRLRPPITPNMSLGPRLL